MDGVGDFGMARGGGCGIHRFELYQSSDAESFGIDKSNATDRCRQLEFTQEQKDRPKTLVRHSRLG